MKNLFIVVVCLLSLNVHANTNDSVFVRSVELSDKVDQLDYILNPAQFAKVNNLFDQIEIVLEGSNTPLCDTQSIFREVFAWARTNQGLGLSRQEAEKFADKISMKNCAKKYFFTYKNAFSWARTTGGLGKNRSEAGVFAEEIANYEQSKYWEIEAMTCIKDEFKFARSTGGLGMSRLEAESFAKRRCLK